METWMIHALLASLFAGTFGIFQKIEAETPSIERDTFIFYSYLFGSIFNLLIFAMLGIEFTWNWPPFLAGIFITGLYVYVLRLRHNCLQYMSSSTYFINYRIFTSIGLLFIGSLFFSEIITFREYLGIGLGFIIFYLLIEKKNPSETKKDLKKGYLYLGISVLLAVAIWVVQKKYTIVATDVWLFLFAASISGMILSLLVSENYRTTLTVPNRKTLLFFIGVGTVFGPGYIFHLYALFEGGDVAIIYKIVSYSLFLPIIFSIIYYKEPVTFKKVIAFLLTIVSIGLFI